MDAMELRPYRNQGCAPFVLGEPIAHSQWPVREARKRSLSNDYVYAQKTISFEADATQADIERVKNEFLQEVKILRKAQHQHVIKFIDAFELQDTPQLSLVMERASGSMTDYLSNTGKRPRIQWFTCLIAAVDYIHGVGIRHRDIKPPNILLKNEKPHLADFGISRMGIGKTLSTSVPNWARARTPEFCAPEVQDGSSRGRSADIFSLGAVFLKMFIASSGSGSMNRMKSLATQLQAMEGPSFAKNVAKVHQFMEELQSPESPALTGWQNKIVSVCRKMLHEDRDERPGSQQLRKELSFLSSVEPAENNCNCDETDHLSMEERLVEACKEGSMEGVKSLLKDGVDPNTVGAIHQASAHGKTDIVQELLDAGTDINLQDYSNQTALHCAAGYKHVDTVKLLCDRGIMIMHADVEGRTALHYAAGAGHEGIVAVLTEKGQDRKIVDCTDQDQQTALHFAAKRGHGNVAETLLHAKAKPFVGDKHERTPLHFASGYGALEVVDLLLSKACNTDLNARDENGWTALHFAADGKRHGGQYIQVVTSLIKAGADLWGENKNEKTAARLAPDSDPRKKLLREAMRQAEQKEVHEEQQARAMTGGTVLSGKGNIPSTFHHDFISLLAIAQYHKVDLWPVAWDNELDQLGAGAMGDVRQSLPLVDAKSQFAFKRFARGRITRRHYDLPEDFTFSVFHDNKVLFEAIISEVLILSQPEIKLHPHIAKIEGIAFDVDDSDRDHFKVWPVLVLQKAHHGSLRKYLDGRSFDLSEKLNFCAQVGSAVLTMHRNNIVHGDIKPENILVYIEDEAVCLKLTDFSYSCMGAAEDDIVRLPKTEPWSAPEYHFGGFKILEAKAMDIYAFGMVCLWLLLPAVAFNTLVKHQELHQHGGNYLAKIRHFIEELALQEDTLESTGRDGLVKFFAATLCPDPRERGNDLGATLADLLGQSLWQPNTDESSIDGASLLASVDHDATSAGTIDARTVKKLTTRMLYNLHLTGEAYDLMRSLLDPVKMKTKGELEAYINLVLEQMNSYSVVSVKKDEKTREFLKHACFNVAYAFYQLVRLDHRVRIHILQCLEKRAHGTCQQCASSAASELAFCYNLGFGVHAERSQAQQWLTRSKTSTDQLTQRLHHLKVDPIFEDTNKYTVFSGRGFFLSHARNRYGTSISLSTETYLSRELCDFEESLGKYHFQLFGLYLQLMDVLCIRGQRNVAMGISRRLQAAMKEHPISNPSRIGADTILANFHLLKYEWEEAENLLVKAKATLIMAVGHEHLMTIMTRKYLASLYTLWGKTEKAEEELALLVPIVDKVLHEDHDTAYQIVVAYAAVLERQNKITEASDLRSRHERKGNEMSHGVLGALTDEYRRGLSAYVGGSSAAAETMLATVKHEAEIWTERSRGQRRSQFITLSRLATKLLALAIRDQNRNAEAERTQRDLLQNMRAGNGPWDEQTMDVVADLARTLAIRKQWIEAKELYLLVKEGRRRLFESAHGKAISASQHLVRFYQEQRKWNDMETECESLRVFCEQQLGTFHMTTLEATAYAASVYSGLPGKPKLADETFARAMEISETVLGPCHEKTLDFASQRATMLTLQRRHQEAKSLLQLKIEDATRVLGLEHEATQYLIEQRDEKIDDN